MCDRFTHTKFLMLGNFFLGRRGHNELIDIGLKCKNVSRLKRQEALLKFKL